MKLSLRNGNKEEFLTFDKKGFTGAYSTDSYGERYFQFRMHESIVANALKEHGWVKDNNYDNYRNKSYNFQITLTGFAHGVEVYQLGGELDEVKQYNPLSGMSESTCGYSKPPSKSVHNRIEQLLAPVSEALSNKVQVRSAGRSTTPPAELGGLIKNLDVIGWFSAKSQPIGWVLASLDKEDEKWFDRENVSTKGVYRVVGDKGTTLVQLNLSSGKYRWFDELNYIQTNSIKFESKWVNFTSLYIDSGKEKSFKL